MGKNLDRLLGSPLLARLRGIPKEVEVIPDDLELGNATREADNFFLAMYRYGKGDYTRAAQYFWLMRNNHQLVPLNSYAPNKFIAMPTVDVMQLLKIVHPRIVYFLDDQQHAAYREATRLLLDKGVRTLDILDKMPGIILSELTDAVSGKDFLAHLPERKYVDTLMHYNVRVATIFNQGMVQEKLIYNLGAKLNETLAPQVHRSAAGTLALLAQVLFEDARAERAVHSDCSLENVFIDVNTRPQAESLQRLFSHAGLYRAIVNRNMDELRALCRYETEEEAWADVDTAFKSRIIKHDFETAAQLCGHGTVIQDLQGKCAVPRTWSEQCDIRAAYWEANNLSGSPRTTLTEWATAVRRAWRYDVIYPQVMWERTDLLTQDYFGVSLPEQSFAGIVDFISTRPNIIAAAARSNR